MEHGKSARQRADREQGRPLSMWSPEPPPGTRVERDIVYARVGTRDLLLDLYLPEASGAPLPVILWIHGGAFARGSKNTTGPALGMPARGYAVVSVDYRLSGEAVFPAQIEDCKAAVRWIRAKAREHGLDSQRVGAWGSSAGGHLAAMLGTSMGVAELEREVGTNIKQSSRVQAVCDWFGPTDFTRMNDFAGDQDHDAAESPESRLIGGPIQQNRGKAAMANPITYISMGAPPFLIMHGQDDRLVPYNQSELLCDALQSGPAEVTLYCVKGAGHGFRNAEEDTPEELFEMAAAFFDKHLQDIELEGNKVRRIGGLPVPQGVVVRPDIAYREGESGAWRLDLAMPEQRGTQPQPVIVFIHGGGWRFGDKRREPFLAPALEFASKGYVCVTVNYRLLDEAPLPAGIEDVKCAVRWLRAHAGQYNADPAAIGAYGNSAGAHLAAMLALCPASAGLEGDGPWQEHSSAVQAVVAGATPAGFMGPMIDRQRERMQSNALPGQLLRNKPRDLPEELRKRISPITYANAGAPPFLLVHEASDQVVGVYHSDELVKALKNAGAEDVTYMRSPPWPGEYGFGYCTTTQRRYCSSRTSWALKRISTARMR